MECELSIVATTLFKISLLSAAEFLLLIKGYWLPKLVRPSSVVHPVLSRECGRRNLLITFIVHSVDNKLKPCKNYWNFVKTYPGNLVEICKVGFIDTLHRSGTAAVSLA